MERTAVDWIIGYVLSNPNMTQEERTHIMRYARTTFQRQIEEAWEHGREEKKPKDTHFGLDKVDCEDSNEYYTSTFA